MSYLNLPAIRTRTQDLEKLAKNDDKVLSTQDQVIVSHILQINRDIETIVTKLESLPAGFNL
jgi:hypothetical protein